MRHKDTRPESPQKEINAVDSIASKKRTEHDWTRRQWIKTAVGTLASGVFLPACDTMPNVEDGYRDLMGKTRQALRENPPSNKEWASVRMKSTIGNNRQ